MAVDDDSVARYGLCGVHIVVVILVQLGMDVPKGVVYYIGSCMTRNLAAYAWAAEGLVLSWHHNTSSESHNTPNF